VEGNEQGVILERREEETGKLRSLASALEEIEDGDRAGDDLVERGVDLDGERHCPTSEDHRDFTQEFGGAGAVGEAADRAPGELQGGEDAGLGARVDEEIDVAHRAVRGGRIDGETERGALHEESLEAGGSEGARELLEDARAEHRVGVVARVGRREGRRGIAERFEDLGREGGASCARLGRSRGGGARSRGR
jgi:hypothetical protein